MALDPQISSLNARVRDLENRVAELERRIRKVWHVEPERLEEGMIVFADGTDWDPSGSGDPGYVQYAGGAWLAL